MRHTAPSLSLDLDEKTKLLLKIREQESTIQVLGKIRSQEDAISSQGKIIDSLQQQLNDEKTKMAQLQESCCELGKQNKDLEDKLSQFEKLKSDHAKLNEGYLSLLGKYVALKNRTFKEDDKLFTVASGRSMAEALEAVCEEVNSLVDENNLDENQLKRATKDQFKILIERMSQVHELEYPYVEAWKKMVDQYDLPEHLTYDDILGLVGQNSLSEVCLDHIVDLQRSLITKNPNKTYPLKRSDFENIDQGKDISELMMTVKDFDQILVPYLSETKVRRHWFMFVINNKNKTVACINPTRGSSEYAVANEGENCFKTMQLLAQKLFPDNNTDTGVPILHKFTKYFKNLSNT